MLLKIKVMVAEMPLPEDKQHWCRSGGKSSSSKKPLEAKRTLLGQRGHALWMRGNANFLVSPKREIKSPPANIQGGPEVRPPEN